MAKDIWIADETGRWIGCVRKQIDGWDALNLTLSDSSHFDTKKEATNFVHTYFGPIARKYAA